MVAEPEFTVTPEARLLVVPATVMFVVVRLTVGAGPLSVPCEVVWAATEERLTGWGYGTLPGHQASGEEAFIVEHDERDRVWFMVRAYSRPARTLMRLGGPMAVVFQHVYARLCGRALKRLCTVNG